MAPFKLKFRMGSSRSTSQEVDADPQANQALLPNSNVGGIGASCSTLDSSDCNSLVSLGNDQRSLLPNCSNSERLGYLNPAASQNSDTSIPNSPPPSYEHVLEENRLANLDRDSNLTPTRAVGGGGAGRNIETNLIQRTSRNTSVEQITSTCTDPECTIVDESRQQGRRNSRKESIDSTELLLPTMTAPSSSHDDNLLDCSSCDPLLVSSQEQITFDDIQKKQHPLQPDVDTDDGQDQQTPTHQHLQQKQPLLQHPLQQECQLSEDEDNCSDGEWSTSQLHHQQHQVQASQPEVITTSEIISNKSSKEIYKAVAKEWGITCKMSDQCRCMECQSHYFDCEFDDNEHQKTDGGLGAGTPMFISEVMQGSACTIL